MGDSCNFLGLTPSQPMQLCQSGDLSFLLGNFNCNLSNRAVKLGLSTWLASDRMLYARAVSSVGTRVGFGP